MSIAKNFTHMFIPYSFNDSIRPRQMTNSRLIAVLQVSDGYLLWVLYLRNSMITLPSFDITKFSPISCKKEVDIFKVMLHLEY